jgi:hypothetical protein
LLTGSETWALVAAMYCADVTDSQAA